MDDITKKLRTIINADPDIMVLKDAKGHWIEANMRALKIFGINNTDYKGKTDSELGNIYPIISKYVSQFVESDRMAWSTGKQTINDEVVVIDNQERYYEVVKTPIYNSNGVPECLVVIGRDISERIRNERRYKSIFVKHPEAMYVLDIQGDFIDVNKKAEVISGYTRVELLKMNFISLFLEQDHPEILKAFIEVKKGNTISMETKIRIKNGDIRYIHITTIPAILDGKIIGIQGIAQDITEKRREKVIKEAQSRLLELVAVGESLPRIYKKLVDLFEANSNGGKCSILFYDKGNNCLNVKYAPSLNKSFLSKVDNFPVGEKNASCGQAAYKKKLIIVSDIENDSSWENWKEYALDHDIRACWSIPILSTKGKLLGTFAVYYNRIQEPVEYEIEMVEVFSYILGLAIEKNTNMQAIKHMAFHDALTGLPNVRNLKHLFENIVEEQHIKNCNLAVLFLDLDKFKSINDTFGHSVGDMLLIKVAKRIQNIVGNSIVARMGGDEFIFIIQNVANESSAKDMVEIILKSIREPILINESIFHITGSIGISMYPDHGISFDILMKKADVAMYTVKSQGGNSKRLYDKSMDEMALEKFIMQSELHSALKENHFVLEYQPKISLKNRKMTGVEALIRWKHPEKGWISPGEFIPLAEESGLILEIGNWVLQEACRQIKKWNKEGLVDISVAVNISIIQFIQQDIPSLISHFIKEIDINPRYLEIEITESMLMKNEKILIDSVFRLKKIGVKVSIDDFGTGYASMTYLKQFRGDTIKIDRSFINSLPDNQEDSAIVTAIIKMANALKMSVIAEGVETKEQADFLSEIGCDEVQGFYFSRPLSAEMVHEYQQDSDS